MLKPHHILLASGKKRKKTLFSLTVFEHGRNNLIYYVTIPGHRVDRGKLSRMIS